MKTKMHCPKRANSYRLRTNNCTDFTCFCTVNSPRAPSWLHHAEQPPDSEIEGERESQTQANRYPSPRRPSTPKAHNTHRHSSERAPPAPIQPLAVGQRATLINFPRRVKRSAAAAARPGKANERQGRHGAAYPASLKRAQRHQSLKVQHQYPCTRTVNIINNNQPCPNCEIN